MSNTYANNITRLCELAFRAYARGIGLTQLSSSSILAGFDDADIMTPRLVFNCDNAEPDGPADDATWACQLEVQCVSNADDRTADQHHDFASEVFSQFMTGRYETLPNAINAAAAAANPVVQFQVFDILPGSQAKTMQERRYLSSMVFKVICCGTPA